MDLKRGIAVVLLALTQAAKAENTGIDPADRFGWSENAGWANAGPTNYGVTVKFDGDAGWLSGYIWGENVGWIKMGTGSGPYANTTYANWGVNMDSDGELAGYAWGENVGWVNFGHSQCDAAINPDNGEFSGHAWAENIGWMKFSGSTPDYGVRTLAFETQALGTPNWWLDYHAVTELYDAGDGVPAWCKYVMDTDPHVMGDVLCLTVLSNMSTRIDITFSNVSTRRYYTLARTENLSEDNWMNVPGHVDVKGQGREQTMSDTNAVPKAFYRVEVTVSP